MNLHCLDKVEETVVMTADTPCKAFSKEPLSFKSPSTVQRLIALNGILYLNLMWYALNLSHFCF